jgi:hypothetical protein
MLNLRCLIKRKGKFLIVISALLVFSGVASGKVLFKDNFEGDAVGAAPKNFEKIDNPTNAAAFKADVADDPKGESGKVAHTSNYAVYVPKTADRDNWTDWVWEWDWMWSEKGYPGTAFRITGNNYYHISPRNDNINVGFWHYNGGWNQKGDLVQYDFGLNTWNRFQVIAKGNEFTFKVKKRDDSTPFADIEPLMQVTDDNLKKGPVSVCGTNIDAWMDNFIVAESEEDLITAVQPNDKLSITWGTIKKIY